MAAEYPEHEKLTGIKDQSQAIGEFLEWLGAQGIVLCRWRDAGSNGLPRYLSTKDGSPSTWGEFIVDRAVENPDYCFWEEGFYPFCEPIESLLARHFEIDTDRLESEKRQMLESLRSPAVRKDTVD